jgi:hypothetical protein
MAAHLAGVMKMLTFFEGPTGFGLTKYAFHETGSVGRGEMTVSPSRTR